MLVFSGCFKAIAILWLWTHIGSDTVLYWPNLAGVCLLLTEQRLAKRHPAYFPVGPALHWTTIVLGSCTLWMLLTKWVQLHAGGFYLTVAWAVLALILFSAGFLLGERIYRWVGLAILGFALGRVIVFDVWKLEAIYRILSFMALGIVLLVLGFIYNKYQEKIRQWL